VTHLFHLWHGREFVLLPVGWTDAVEPDVFVTAAAGRCPFRLADLTALAGLIDGLRGGSSSAAV
jgi:uncharacterized protein DUF5372